jgi:glycosyltransferase involved in cell wall biosynthesis
VNKAANILIAGYAFCAGGGETFPILLANLMKARGYNVTFLDCNQVPRLAAVRASLRSDIPVVSELTYLRNMVKTFNIDLIHSQHAWVDCSVAEIIKEREPMDCQTVVTMHGMYEMMPDSSRDRCIKLLSKHTAHFVYTAEKNLGAFESFYKEKLPPITRIDNALDVYPFEALERASIGVPEEVFVLTLISRAVPEKGWSEAVESIKIAREKSGQDIHLILIGEGAAYDELQQQTLPDYIHLEGFRKNIRAYFAASDLGFLPSRFEGESFPLVIIDALHAGIPVLASAIGEIPYMLQTDAGPAGVLFDLTENWQIDTDVLAQKIAEIATDRTLYLQLKSNVPSAAAKFDPEHMTDAYDAVYKSAIAGEA